MVKIFLSFILLTGFLFASVGKIITVNGEAKVIRGASELVAKSGMSIEEKDTIKTTISSKLQIIFTDDTLVTVGKSSEFSVQEYFYEEGAAKPKASFGMANGTFRAITGVIGKVAPDNFKLTTKSATIGIRGTQIYADIKPEFDFVACTEGMIVVTSLATGKSVEVPAGTFTIVKSDEAPQAPQTIEAGKLDEEEVSVVVNEQIILVPLPLVETPDIQTLETTTTDHIKSNELNITIAKAEKAIEDERQAQDIVNTCISNYTEQEYDYQLRMYYSDFFYGVLVQQNADYRFIIAQTLNPNDDIMSLNILPDGLNSFIESFDYVDWGYWNSVDTSSVSHAGYYISANPNDYNVLDPVYMPSGNAIYNGQTLSSVGIGTMNLNFDFHNRTILGSMDIDGSATAYSPLSVSNASYDGVGDLNVLKISKDTLQVGAAYGEFYGAQGGDNIYKNYAGNFEIKCNNNEIRGVFATQKQ